MGGLAGGRGGWLGWLVDGVWGGWLGWLVDGLAGWLVGLVGWLDWLGWQVELARAIGFDLLWATALVARSLSFGCLRFKKPENTYAIM